MPVPLSSLIDVPRYTLSGGGVLAGGGQGRFCTRVSGLRTDPAVAEHVPEVLTPLALQAALDAADQIEAGHDAALDQWRRQAEQARYATTRAERDTAPSTRKTGWSPVAWRPNGKPRCKPTGMPKPSWTAAKPPGPSGSARTSARRSSPSPPTCPRCGPPRPPPTAAARKSCNQQQRRTATGMSFTPANVATIRKRHDIPATSARLPQTPTVR